MKKSASLASAALLFLSGQPVVAQDQDEQLSIAIIDTGVVSTSRMTPSIVESYDLRNGASTQKIVSAHGTLVAGVLVRNLKQPVKILSYRADIKCPSVLCQMDQAAIAKSIVDAVDRGARIIQISSYGVYAGSVQKAVAYAAQKGVKIVFCAGNEGGQTPLFQTLKNNPDVVYVVGSLSGKAKSSYSANIKGFADLMSWRQGEGLRSWDDKGRSVEVEGTSYAASILTADLANAYADHVAQTGRAPTEIEWRMRVMADEKIPSFARQQHVIYDDALGDATSMPGAQKSPAPVLSAKVEPGKRREPPPLRETDKSPGRSRAIRID